MIENVRILKIIVLALLGWLMITGLLAQKNGTKQEQRFFYPTRFNLEDVTLLDGPFRKAQELNFKTLLEYDVDRLLTPYVRQAGLSVTTDVKSPYFQWEYEHPAFTSFAWNPAMAMDGHFLGHYLSALSLAYAACHEEAPRAQFKERLDYIVRVLRDCQAVFDEDKEGMKGFIGGVPDNSIWTSMLDADYQIYNQRGYWTPLYCEHKVLAGLRDAYLYGDNQMAKAVLRKMCDWLIRVVSLFSGDIMEMQILQWETGAINEVLADAYEIFGDSKYLKAAQKYSHRILIENILHDDNHLFLDKKHTNQLTAQFLGFSRISQLKHEPNYGRSAQRYWEEVVNRRATAIGGVGVGGYFTAKGKSSALLKDADGPDLCTTCNMLKITQNLFASSPDARYAEYYERALLNHVLACQDPVSGGFSYFTAMRPEGYRIYSSVNASMWCCAGSGLESQSRYGEFIYSYAEDTLYVNLFLPSELKSEVVSVRQESTFPYGNSSRLQVLKSGSYKIAVRHPAWTTTQFSIKVNGAYLKLKGEKVAPGHSSYVCCGRSWKAGDVIEVHYPMAMSVEPCPGQDDHVALRYGPTVLAAQTTDNHPGSPLYEELPHEMGGEGMYDFSPKSRGKFPNPAYAPMLICERGEVQQRLRIQDASTLSFVADVSAKGASRLEVPVKPFFDLHHARYVLYWNQQTEEAWLRNPLYQNQIRRAQMDAFTFDVVTPGEDESEIEHEAFMSETGSRGSLNGRPFRDTQPFQWFEYTFKTQGAQELIDKGENLELVCLFSTIDRGRSCCISIDGQEVASYKMGSLDGGVEKFFDRSFPIPNHLLKGKDKFVLRIASWDGSYGPRCFKLRFMKKLD